MSYRLLRAGEIKTRKSHRCEWCNERIEVGAVVFSRTYFWEGELRTGHMHPECEAAYNEMDNVDLQDGWTPGDFARGSTEQ